MGFNHSNLVFFSLNFPTFSNISDPFRKYFYPPFSLKNIKRIKKVHIPALWSLFYTLETRILVLRRENSSAKVTKVTRIGSADRNLQQILQFEPVHKPYLALKISPQTGPQNFTIELLICSLICFFVSLTWHWHIGHDYSESFQNVSQIIIISSII